MSEPQRSLHRKLHEQPLTPPAQERTVGWRRVVQHVAAQLWRHALGAVAYAIVVVLAATERLGDGADRWTQLATAVVWSILVYEVIGRLIRSQLERSPATDRLLALELGLSFIAAAMSLVTLLGGLTGPTYPLVYALIAYFAAFSRTVDVVVFFVALIGLEGIATFAGEPSQAEKLTYLSHVTWSGFFAVLYALFLRGDLAERRRQTATSIRKKLEHILADARDYRLFGAVNNTTADDGERRRAVSSVSAVREAVYNLLSVGESALSPNNLALFVLDAAGSELRMKEARGAPEQLAKGALSVREGVFGGILAKQAPLVLTQLRNYRGLVYYGNHLDAGAVREFVGVPLIEGAHVRGALIADRITDKPFTDAEVALLETIATEAMRTIEVERLFSEMDHERRSREKFFRAHQGFGSARTNEEVAEAAYQAASHLCTPALVALTSCSEDGKGHMIRALRGPRRAELEGQVIADASALVCTAVKTRSVLPLPGVPLGEHSLFGKSLSLPGLSDARVFPLLSRDRPLGAWVVGLGSGKFAPDVEQMLAALAFQVGISCANASLNEAMETMATTDGLTGLHNRRHFTQMCNERLLRSERYGRKCTVIMCDIDHFKSVNDTYGHPTGDVVLKTVSRLLQSEARKTDAVGRLGGEEFAIMMEETDTRGARQTAERIRERVEKEIIHSEMGKLSVTMSLGIATFPDDGNSLELLISRADEALYRAKHGGRNRTVAFQGAPSGRHGSK